SITRESDTDKQSGLTEAVNAYPRVPAQGENLDNLPIYEGAARSRHHTVNPSTQLTQPLLAKEQIIYDDRQHHQNVSKLSKSERAGFPPRLLLAPVFPGQ